MSEWTAMVEQAIQRCKGAELQARKERKMWETLKKRLPEAETHPFAILTLIDQLRSLNSPFRNWCNWEVVHRPFLHHRQP
jgi:hypothetical protein